MDKKNLIKIFTIIAFLIILIFFIITLINYKTIKTEVSSGVQKYGYFGIGITSLILESLPQPIGADITLISGGLIGLNIFFVFLVVILSSGFSGILMYFLGYVRGKGIVLLFIDEEHYKEYLDLFKNKGKFAMTISALTPIPYLPILAGTLKMHFYDFLLYGIVMRTLRFAVVAYLFFIILT
ncbi:hypothetical protein CMI39_00425 [Candidatus Pacearchaeota archaeon]|jgi:membrane protein YqaA with SNARE-associated domain|nr:hypothetical protein [Candidatus Pacearchaeota archaeon]|tara:strand:- start:2135 stop:2680 length:546 start_codon:yes stop_codon:yes gene_type:complete